jgi:hypothetical protein
VAKTTTDHDTIRQWAESHAGRPAVVKSTRGRKGVGILRIEFPEAPVSDHEALEVITWDDFFKQFEDAELALVYDEKSNFNKLIGRDTAKARAAGDHKAARVNGRSREGTEKQSRSGTERA